jgi:hypothetical protein
MKMKKNKGKKKNVGMQEIYTECKGQELSTAEPKYLSILFLMTGFHFFLFFSSSSLSTFLLIIIDRCLDRILC